MDRRSTRSLFGLLAASAISAAAPVGAQDTVNKQGDWRQVDERLVGEGVIEPLLPHEFQAQSTELTTQEREELLLRKLRKRENNARRYSGFSRATGDLRDVPEEEVPETEVIDGPEFLEGDDEFDIEVVNPQNLVIGRNSRNTRAQVAGNSTLAEPAAANNGPLVFAAGNFAHAEFSNNGGATWTNIPLPGGPADAPILAVTMTC